MMDKGLSSSLGSRAFSPVFYRPAAIAPSSSSSLLGGGKWYAESEPAMEIGSAVKREARGRKGVTLKGDFSSFSSISADWSLHHSSFFFFPFLAARGEKEVCALEI